MTDGLTIFKVTGFSPCSRLLSGTGCQFLERICRLLVVKRKPDLRITDDFCLKSGKMYAVVGKSGCGKTVLNSLFMGCPAFSLGKVSGEMEFFGMRIKGEIFNRRSRVETFWKKLRRRGVLLYLPQQLPDGRGFDMSVKEYYLQITKALLKECRVGETDRNILSIFGAGKEGANRGTIGDLASSLSNKLSRPLNLLSGGERRRIELIARMYALSRLPKRRQALLVLDEPTTGLDVPGVRDYLKTLRKCFTTEVNGRVAILVTTHALHLLDNCDGIVFDEVILVRKHESSTVSCSVSKPIDLLELNRKWIHKEYSGQSNAWAAFLERQASYSEAEFLREKARFLGEEGK